MGNRLKYINCFIHHIIKIIGLAADWLQCLIVFLVHIINKSTPASGMQNVLSK